MATKLHQILALEKGARGQTEGEVTKAYHDAARQVAFLGLTRTYTPRDAEGERMPVERKIPQLTADTVIARAVAAWVRQADLVATKDATNQFARADVRIGAQVILESVPVTTLLYLEKMLQNVRELISKLPVLDAEVEWGTAPDAATGLWKSAVEETVRTKKVPKAFVKYEATDRHPAQVDMFTEDVVVGSWMRTQFSGALSATRKRQLMERAATLTDAVKMAREYANQEEIIDKKIGAAIFDHLLAP